MGFVKIERGIAWKEAFHAEGSIPTAAGVQLSNCESGERSEGCATSSVFRLEICWREPELRKERQLAVYFGRFHLLEQGRDCLDRSTAAPVESEIHETCGLHGSAGT